MDAIDLAQFTDYGRNLEDDSRRGVVHIITRRGWDALPPRSGQFSRPPFEAVVFSATRTRMCKNPFECSNSVQELQFYYMDIKKLPDLPFNFLVGGDGLVYEGRGWPIAVKEKNHLVIAYMDKVFETQLPLKEMKDTAYDLIAHGVNNGLISKDYEEYDEWD